MYAIVLVFYSQSEAGGLCEYPELRAPEAVLLSSRGQSKGRRNRGKPFCHHERLVQM